MKSIIPPWLPLCCALWLCHSAAFAQAAKLDLEEQAVARLAGGDEETRLTALVELASLFKGQRHAARPATMAALIQTLQKDAVPVLRTHAARALEFAVAPSATDALITALQSERETTTRKAILYALARYESAPVVAALIPFLRHKEAETRATAAYALAELADTAAASALHECLVKRRKAEDAFTRSEAARALGRIGYHAAVPDLRKALLKDAAIDRRAAAEALGWLALPQDQEVLAALQAAANDEDPYLRAAATLALQRISERALSKAPKFITLNYS